MVSLNKKETQINIFMGLNPLNTIFSKWRVVVIRPLFSDILDGNKKCKVESGKWKVCRHSEPDNNSGVKNLFVEILRLKPQYDEYDEHKTSRHSEPDNNSGVKNLQKRSFAFAQDDEPIIRIACPKYCCTQNNGSARRSVCQ